MKLITLNVWGGHVKKPLLDFIQAHKNVDIFCFQEVYQNAERKTSSDIRDVHLNIFSEIHDLLPDHQTFFRPVLDNTYGIGAFVKKEIDVLGEGQVWIHEQADYPGHGAAHSRNLQWLECAVNQKIFSVMNVHGLWNGMGKTDTPARLEQSQRIRNFMDTINTPKILCGDFNLRPDTESLSIIEAGMINHVKINKVSSTRTSFYPKEEKFADYIFTSPEIKVKHFEVMKDEVSDHAALLLDFEV